MKTVRAWAKVTRGELTDVTEIYGDRSDAIRCLNRPAGESVIEVKIMEVKPSRTKRLARLSGRPIGILDAAVSKPRKFAG